MVQIKEYAPSSAKLKVLIYGKSGTGKTTFGATAPNALFVSSESGLLSVADKHVKYVKIDSLKDLEDVYQLLAKPGHGFESVILDSLTDMQNHIITKITKGERMPMKGEWSDFGFNMNKILLKFRDLDIHVIGLALEKDIEGEDDTSMLQPDLYGSVRDKCPAYFDYVGRIAMWGVQDENGAKKEKRGICFVMNKRFTAKARRGQFDAITEPDFNEILKRATIEVGQEKVVADVPSTETTEKAAAPAKAAPVAQPAPAAPILVPRVEGDVMRSSDQSTQILTLWKEFMSVRNVPLTEHDAQREGVMMKYYGTKSMNMLRSKQAAHFIDMIINGIEQAKKKQQLPIPAQEQTQQEYDVAKDLERREQLNKMLKDDLLMHADAKGIAVKGSMTKEQIIDEIIILEMPNSPIAQERNAAIEAQDEQAAEAALTEVEKQEAAKHAEGL